MRHKSIVNPYERLSGKWIRGNFHGHSSERSSCSSMPLYAGLERYRDMGAAFTAVTDHDHVTDLSRARTDFPGMVLLSGFEHSSGENLLFIGEEVPPLHSRTLADAIENSDGLLTVACHPKPRPADDHWSLEKLLRLPRLPDGIEIYNGHYGVPLLASRGCVPKYTPFWDELLTAGIHVWGFANDDSHDPPDLDNAWNMVNVDAGTAPEIMESAKRGRFYSTTGLLADEISGRAGSVTVRFDKRCTGRFVGPGGSVLYETIDSVFRYEMTDESYVRFEAAGKRRAIWRLM